jgi:hypothetical protein
VRHDALRLPVSLLVVTGPPGAGKSTVAALVADRLSRSVLIEGDAFFAFLRSGAIEPWRPGSHAQNEIVVEAAALATGRFARDYVTVYDGVIGPWFVETFLGATGLDELHYAVLFPDRHVRRARDDPVEPRVSRRSRGPQDARRVHAQRRRSAPRARQLGDG